MQHLAFIVKRRGLVDDVHRAVGELVLWVGGQMLLPEAVYHHDRDWAEFRS